MAGNSQPWVPFYPSDWLAGTRGMSAVETGIYITLLMTMYERGEPIPRDDARMARLCGVALPTFRKLLARLIDQGKVTDGDGGLWNDRASLELKKRDEISQAAKQNASARWNKKPNQNNGNRDAVALRRHSGRNANHNHNKPPISPRGDLDLVTIREGDPIVPWLENQRGRPFIWGNRSTTTVTRQDIESATALANGQRLEGEK